MNLTEFIFFLRDTQQGFKISKNLKEIQQQMKEKPSDKRLNFIINHATSTVPFYKEFKGKNIEDLPVVNKTLIKSKFESFRSDELKDKKQIAMTTSGSTGTPFTVYQDWDKKLRNYADTMYFEQKGGHKLGDRLLYFKIWAKEKMSSGLLYKAQNVIPIDVIKLGGKEIKEILDGIEANNGKTHAVVGYVSALEEVIRYCERNNISKLPAQFSGVITISESLNSGTKEKLKKLFNCSVVSRYSNLENGILAQQETSSDRFLINKASYFIEILDMESDRPVKLGEKGRIVVTDLYNRAMPMLRYDTGDIGSMEFDGINYFLTSVEGRKLDLLFDTKGNVVSSYIMYKNMWKYNEISQYQLIQTGEKDYLFKINCPENFDKEKQLVSEFKEYLGEDANFKVEYVDELVLLDSGKRRKTVNLYRNKI